MEYRLLLSRHLQVAILLNPWNQWLAIKSTYWQVWETQHLQSWSEQDRFLLAKFLPQRPVMWSFDVFFDLRLKKWLSKQSWGWWFETPPCSLWHQCNAVGLHWKPRVVMCTINCHNDNFQCHHWWWSWHNDKSDIQCIFVNNHDTECYLLYKIPAFLSAINVRLHQ